MIFQQHFSLQQHNTFGLPCIARFYAQPTTESELAAILQTVTARNLPVLIVGGGSNLLLQGDFAGLAIKPRLMGIRCVASTATTVLIEAHAGENWHQFVSYCLSQGWYGLENLSLIPGTVGAAPMQNIGAYGVEVKDCLHSVVAMSRQTGQLRKLTNAECRFAYRDSVFKQELANQYVITRVRFCLSTIPSTHIAYGDIQTELTQRGITTPKPQHVAQAIIAIRQRKLPDPQHIGNAGSFFKNPVVSHAQFQRLKDQYPKIVAYPQAEGVKLAAGWLIDQLGWKGRSLGAAGVYEQQALVLVNRGGATGAEILQLAQAIQQDVWQHFAVQLDIEPVIV